MEKLNNILKWGKSSKAVFGIIGFLIGRTIFFDTFNPFIIAYVTAFFCKREFVSVAIMSVLGLISVSGKINIFRYVFAIVVLGLFNMCTDRESLTKSKTMAISSLSTFTGGIIYTLFSNMSPYYAIMSVMETGLAQTLYLVIVDNIGVLNFFDLNVVQAEGYSKQVQLVISQRLKKASNIFSSVANNYSNSMLIEEIEEEKTRDSIISNICDNVCASCSLNVRCWGKNRVKTYNLLYEITDKWLKNGYVKYDMAINRMCKKSGELLMLSKGCVEKYNLNKMWLNKIEQSKLLIGRQLEIMSELLGSLHKEVAKSFDIDKELSNKIYKNLTSFSVNSVVAINGERGCEVWISIPHCYNCNSCGDDLQEHISEILDTNMVKENSMCRVENNNCILIFRENPSINIATFRASVKKEDSNITGDCFTYMELEDGKYLIALADGMGSGDEAREESAASIEMYEGFMEAGFDQSMALEIINSVLMAGNENEYFSTLDICTIDRYSGKVQFVKIGAVSTFILSDDKIELIKAQSLPVGILDSIDTEVISTTVKKGDMIIMVTDGILDSTGNVLRNEDWLIDLIGKNQDKSPKNLADIILHQAKINSHNIVRDDMTVLVSQIY